jgi:hypothetical protein
VRFFICLLLIFQIPAIVIAENASQCNPLKINFISGEEIGIDMDVQLGDKTTKSGPTFGTAIIMCNGYDLEIEDTTIVHMMMANDRGFCYVDKSCGNLNEMRGFFSIGVGVSVFSYFSSFLSQCRERDYSLSLDVIVGFAEFERYCTEISEPICISYESE